MPESSLGVSRARQLSIAVEAIRTQFLENMHYAYTIFDEQGNRLAQSQYFPQFCLDHCQSGITDGIGTAADGREALGLIQQKKTDLAFLDIQMPIMDGFEVIQKIQGIKVIIITAFDSFEYAQKALRMGASDIISKPIDHDQLREAIQRTIGWNFTGNETVNQILALIHQHYNDKIELSELARQTYCTESHIARLFKKHMGISIISYVHKVRIETAIQMLKNEPVSINEIAHRTGYQNLNNFYKHFKEFTGETPASICAEFNKLI